MDDPLSLLAFAVWTLAAGMYPLGFMFGVCSACCDECPPCSFCTQFYNLSPNHPNPDFHELPCYEKFDSVTVTASCSTCSGSIVLNNVFPDDNEKPIAAIDNLVISDEIECDEQNVQIKGFVSFFYPDPQVDECGCRACRFKTRLELYANDPDTAPIRLELVAFFDRCSQTQTQSSEFLGVSPVLEQTATLTAAVLNERFGLCNHTFTEDIVFTVSLELDSPCECGACCRDGNCLDNVTEDYCEVFTGPVFPGGGAWVGVGTACDDDPPPCAE